MDKFKRQSSKAKTLMEFFKQRRECKTDIPLRPYLFHCLLEQKMLAFVYQIYQEHVLRKDFSKTQDLVSWIFQQPVQDQV